MGSAVAPRHTKRHGRAAARAVAVVAGMLLAGAIPVGCTSAVARRDAFRPTGLAEPGVGTAVSSGGVEQYQGGAWESVLPGAGVEGSAAGEAWELARRDVVLGAAPGVAHLPEDAFDRRKPSLFRRTTISIIGRPELIVIFREEERRRRY